MAKNQQLADIARDYFYFVTKFFGVISVSAPHIYHSALVISPHSSVIRKNYYCQPFWHAKPWAVYGVPSSWDLNTFLNVHYASYTWSPCGQFFSTLSSSSVEEWDATILEKRSHLQPHAARKVWSVHDYFPDALAYSPDGHSLSCFFGSVIVIWDLKTGGVVEEIETNVPSGHNPYILVWSSDETTIHALFLEEDEDVEEDGDGEEDGDSEESGDSDEEGHPSEHRAWKKNRAWEKDRAWVKDRAWAVTAYDITSGKKAYGSIVQSSVKPHLWLHGTSLQVMAMVYDNNSQATINILEIQPNSINNLIESFPVNNLIELLPQGTSTRISFSPSTYQVSAVTPVTGTLFVFDIQSSKVLLQRDGYYPQRGSCFSPDGSLLAAFQPERKVIVWEYMPEQGYTLQTTLPFQDSYKSGLQGSEFSPLSSAILMSSNNHLEVRHLEGPRTNYQERSHCYAIFFNSGTCVVTTSGPGSIFTITNLQNGSSQCIDTKFKIHRLAITGNILLVQGENMVAGWQLITQGTVDKVFDRSRGDCGGKLWTKPVPLSECLWSSTHDHIGAIKISQDLIYYYDIETGVELDPMTVNIFPPSWSPWKEFKSNGLLSLESPNYDPFPDICYPTEAKEMGYKAWLQEGWVKHHEGEQHLFWIPPEWRQGWEKSYWIENVTTLVLKFRQRSPAIIKV